MESAVIMERPVVMARGDGASGILRSRSLCSGTSHVEVTVTMAKEISRASPRKKYIKQKHKQQLTDQNSETGGRNRAPKQVFSTAHSQEHCYACL